MRVNGLHKSIFDISLVGFFFFLGGGGGLCASSWRNVKSFFENVLLAGEMLKSEKPTFNISPVGAFFFFWGGGVLLVGEMLKTFLKMCFWLGKC